MGEGRGSFPESSTSGARTRAVVISKPGGPEVLDVVERRQPTPRDHEVLVRIRASALNRADLLQRRGVYPAPPGVPADVPGLEFAGEIVGLGRSVSRWHEGDRVFGLCGGGAHAELLVADERTIAAIPRSLPWAEAAAVPEAFITAHDALVTQGDLRRGECVLIHAVGSGVGVAALQIVRAWGAVPFGTARTAEKIERARAFGLAEGATVAGTLEPLTELTAAWTAGHGFDVVLDLVGGVYVGASVPLLGHRGRLILVGLLAGRSTTIDLGAILRNRLTIRGTVLRSRSLEEKVAVTTAFAEAIVPRLADGALRPVIDRRYSLAEVREAHAYLESNAAFGKVVLEIAP